MKKPLIERLIVVSNSSSQPRIHKRVDAIYKLMNIKVFGFRRRFYEGNRFPGFVDYHSLGYIEDGGYFKRLPKLIRSWAVILKEANKRDGLYAFGFDCFLIGKLAGINYSIIELGDLRSAKKPNSLVARLERLFLRRANRIVITSPYFYENYFKKYGFDENKFILLENKLPRTASRPEIKNEILLSNERIRIGLIGFFRYRREIQEIVSYVESNSDRYTLECFGSGPCLDVLLDADCESIHYHGEFKSPDDLEKIYGQVDLNYVCYDSNDENVKIALPNKYYESLFYNTPIICSEGTALQREVEKNEVGLSINFSEGNADFAALECMDRQFIEKCVISCSNYDVRKLLDDSEATIDAIINADCTISVSSPR